MKQLPLLLMAVSLVFAWLSPALAQPEQPDERILWQLYHADNFQLLRQAIEEYRQRYPGWSPPQNLIRLLQKSGRSSDSVTQRQRIETAIQSENWVELVHLARRYPQHFNCRRTDYLRALALAHARSGTAQEAWKRYHMALSCPDAPLREILAESLWQLPTPFFRKLLESVRGRLTPSDYTDFNYRILRRQLIEAHRRRDWQKFQHFAETLFTSAIDRGDLDLLSLVGWTWYEREAWLQAIRWFQAGRKRAPNDEDLIYGVLSSYIHLGRDEEVFALANRHGRQSARLGELAGNYGLQRAWALYRQKRYADSRIYAERALSWLADAEPAEFLLAWLDMKNGLYENAQHRFERLYRTHPYRTDYAEGLLFSHLEAGADPERLAHRFSQPVMQELLVPYRAQRYYDRKQFLRADRVNPNAFPPLMNIDSPASHASGLYRFKSGDSGLDRLHTVIAPLYGGSYIAGNQSFAFHAGFGILQSGKLQGSSIGALQASQEPLTEAQQKRLEQEARQLREAPPTRTVRAALLAFSYRREGPFNPYFQIGLTPIGGPLTPRPTFRLGVSSTQNIPFSRSSRTGHSPFWQLHWNMEIYSQPVRQSLLSYTGWKMSGEKWGRVLRNGLKLSGVLQINSNWSLYQSLDTAFLDGRRTKDNWTIGYTIAPGYSLPVEGVDYFSLGPYFTFMHYDNNQNHFRPGHGGYFSPQTFYAGGMQLNLRTEEGKKLLLEGSFAAGIQHFHEQTESWFPLKCGGQAALLCNLSYPANRKTSFAPSARIRMVWQAHPHLQVTGGIYARRTSGYREAGGGLSLRFLFKARKAVFSTDLPGFLFDVLE
ncbi:MAG: cellulose synthase subunit BcsC-related outer membrane protein [Methylohalobius sp. ZOD2]